jgi:hypothetical protein
MTTAIVSTLIGGLLALAGAFIGPFLQRKHDRWLAHRADDQMLRHKAEELFSELDTLTDKSGKASIRVVERLKNAELDTIPLPDLGHVRALAIIYFPKLLPHLDQFQNDIDELWKKLIPDLGTASEALDAGKIQGLGVVTVIQHQQISTKLVQAVRREMVEVTPKFEDK